MMLRRRIGILYVVVLFVFTCSQANAILNNSLYMQDSSSKLYVLNDSTGFADFVGSIGVSGVSDIAFDGSKIIGITSTKFLTIDPEIGNGQVVGYHGFSQMNALAVGPNGIIYSASKTKGNFIKINPLTGEGILIGNYGAGLTSSGDFAFSTDGILYASVDRPGYSNDWLALIELDTGEASLIGDIGYNDVYGLSFKNGMLYGVTESGKLLSIDISVGSGVVIGQKEISPWGMTTTLLDWEKGNVIAQRPMAGPAGTMFTQWGTGFTPNGNVTLHFFNESGQEIGTEVLKTYSDGSFEVRYTAPETQPVGIYEWYAVDETTGRTSNTVTYEITSGPYPEIGNFPQRGTVETVFEQIGTGFTPGGTATQYFFDSQGQPNGTQNVSINNYGNFKISYDPPDAKPLGRYGWYASDNSTGRETLELSYWIDSPSPPTGSQSVNEDPSATSSTDPEYPLPDQMQSLENVVFNPEAEVTTILVHGWQQDTDRTSAWHVPWVNTMAQLLRNREDMNVLAFNWLKDARGEDGAPPSQELVEAHGETLAEEIRNLFYVHGFQGKFHLITHSAGTGVCYQAVDSLTRGHNRISIDHLTTLDAYLFDADKAIKELKDFQEPWTASASKARSILLKSWIAAYRNVPILENVFMDHYIAGVGTVSQILAFGHMMNTLVSGNNNYIFHPDFRVVEESHFFQDKVSDQSNFVQTDPGLIGVVNELYHKPPVNWYLASIVDQLRLAGASQNSDNHPYGYYWASILENDRPRKGTEKLLVGFQDYFDLHSALTIFGPLVADPLLEISAAIEDEVREQMELLIRLEKMAEALGRKVIIKNADFLDNSVDWVSSQASKVYYDAKGFFWLESGSPTMLSKDYQIPADTPFLGVMYKAVQADGMDSISLFINDKMVWSKPLKSQVGDGLLISSLIDVSEWAGQTVRLTFRVNSFENPSAIVEIHDLIFAELGNVEEIWNYDGDQDGMADAWEILHHGSTDFGGSDDSDEDGLTDLDEFELGTEPKLMDTDGDGKNDLEEVQTNDNPLVASTPDGNPVTRPKVDAGENQTVCEGTLVTLVGTASEVAGYPSFEWEQVSGPAVPAFPAFTPNTRFIAPEVDAGGALMTLKVTVTDSTDGMASDTCDVQVVNREPGDMNCSQDLDLQDAIISLRILAGQNFSDDLTTADVTGEGKIELSEAIYILQAVAEKR